MKKSILKRIFAAGLSLAIASCMTVPAFASTNNGDHSGSGDYGTNYIYNTTLHNNKTLLSGTKMVIGNNTAGTLSSTISTSYPYTFASPSISGNEYYTQYAQSAKYETDTDGSIIIKTTHDSKNNNTGNFSITTEAIMPRAGNTAHDSRGYSEHQIWEVSVKLPSVATGTWTRLFHYSPARNQARKYISAVMIAGDKVYVMDQTNNTLLADGSADYIEKGIPLNVTLTANAYYRFVRVMDFSGTKAMSKVLVYNDADVLLAESDWLPTCGNVTPQATILFQSCGYTDANVCFKDFNLYTSNAAVKDITVSTEADSVNANRIISVYAAKDKTATKENRLAASGNISATDNIRFGSIYSKTVTDEEKGTSTTEYYSDNEFTFDFNLQDVVSGGDGAAKFIGYHIDNAYMNKGAVAYLFQVAEDGTVSTLYNAAGESGTYAVTKAGTSDALKLNPLTWYSVKVTKEIASNSSTEKNGIFTLEITEKATGSKVADLSGIKVPGSVGAKQAFTLMSVFGVDYPILLDEITGAFWTDKYREKYDVTKQIFSDIDNAEEENGNIYTPGDDLMIKSGIVDMNVFPTLNFAFVRSDSNLYAGGAKVQKGSEIKITFGSDIDATTFTQENVRVLKNDNLATDIYTLSYDSATKTGTVTLTENLSDEDIYELEITSDVRTAQFDLPVLFTGKYNLIPVPQPKFTTAVTNANGVTVDSYAKGDTVKAAITFENYEASENPDSCVMIMAEYDNDGALLKSAKIVEPDMQNGTVYTDAVTLTAENPLVKIFVWDNLNNLSPLAY